jgi:hypothetical protein
VKKAEERVVVVVGGWTRAGSAWRQQPSSPPLAHTFFPPGSPPARVTPFPADPTPPLALAGVYRGDVCDVVVRRSVSALGPEAALLFCSESLDLLLLPCTAGPLFILVRVLLRAGVGLSMAFVVGETSSRLSLGSGCGCWGREIGVWVAGAPVGD